MRRLVLGTCLLSILVVWNAAARAGEKPADVPAVVVRVKSVNALLSNLGLVVKLVGQENAAHQIEAVVKSKIGKQGIEGIDPTRPLGAYVRYGKEIDDVAGALLIPIADKATFLTLIDNLGIKVKEENGIYTHKTAQNFDVYFRFANKYLYVTAFSAESIKDKNLPDPEKALALDGDATFSILARVDQIPGVAKTIALIKLQEAIDAAKKDGLPNETTVQKEFRHALLDDLNKIAQKIIGQAGDVRFDLDVNTKTNEVTVNVTIAGKPKSDLAKSIAVLGSFKSPLAAVVTKDAAFHGAVHVALPEALHRAFEKVIDEAADESLKGIQDATKKKQADALFKAILPSAKAGEYHVVGAILGPKDDRYTFLGAVQLKDGLKLGAAVHQLIAEARMQIPDEDKKKIQLDFAEVGKIKIHQFEVPSSPLLDPLIADVAGDKHLYLAFRDDALFLALGKDSLTTLKAMLAKTDTGPSPPLQVSVDAVRMAHWLARTPKQKDFADKVRKSGDPSRIHVTIEGGTTLRLNARTHFNVLELLLKQEK